MSDRFKFKEWKYALMLFIATNEVGIVKTKSMVDGFKTDLREDSYVKVKWENTDYMTRILHLAGNVFISIEL